MGSGHSDISDCGFHRKRAATPVKGHVNGHKGTLEDDRWLTKAEAARYLGLSEKTIQRGRVKYGGVLFGRALRFKRSALDAAGRPLGPSSTSLFGGADSDTRNDPRTEEQED